MSIFSRIISGEIPAYKVAEDDQNIAFLDVQPVALGHTLVVPKQEVDYLFDMDAEAYGSLWAFAQKVAIGLKAAVPCLKVGVTVIGLEVPHAHIHLVPMQTMEDISFAKPRLKMSGEEMAGLAVRIDAHIRL